VEGGKNQDQYKNAGDFFVVVGPPAAADPNFTCAPKSSGDTTHPIIINSLRFSFFVAFPPQIRATESTFAHGRVVLKMNPGSRAALIVQ